MKVAAILKPLDEFEKWYVDRGQHAETTALRELASFLKEHERKNVPDLAAAIRSSRLQEAESIGSTWSKVKVL